MTRRVCLDVIEIASPCDVPWESMPGDLRKRLCGVCDKPVYDFAQMTRDEAEALVGAAEGGLCVRLTRRADGRVVTADCTPVRVARARKAARRSIGLAVAMAGAVAGLLGGVGYLLSSEALCTSATRTASVTQRLGNALADKIDPQEDVAAPGMMVEPVHEMGDVVDPWVE